MLDGNLQFLQAGKGTAHLQTSMPSPGFELKRYGMAVSINNHYTGMAALQILQPVMNKGGIQENRTWRRRSNLDLYRSYKESDMVNFIKIQRIKWAGHVIRMNVDRTTKKSLQCSTNRHTKKGQAKSRMD
ncbi:hypothetical protein TNCV_4968841 [Trichonephila clavipes]|nr:hypothetical protein TNCV_4968841 [Trichonephila clavipes]